ncbi:hydrolase-like protein, putative [Eimeria tenella]|uniref:Hydrolase-like protein, putative n=1 Tax=Eimeria tenella TaxID=5802 RepID=U6KUI7_EIMTE|nr:hydrolase-like protein, putative [Eimeria tenella]CDJ40578.1 hydrolase-like protein, putative [Eimeria tenella]|eukprot:XP_013231328.1 hydrolase-like protein, putative [Eimeria tenella]
MAQSVRDRVAAVSPLFEDICSNICRSGSGSSSGSTDAAEAASSSSSSSSSGVLFLGSGGSASIPQLNHILSLSDPSHPYHLVARRAAPPPPLQELQQQAVLYRQHLKQQQQQQRQQEQQAKQGALASDGGSALGGAAAPAAAAAEPAAAAAAAAAAAGLEGRALEVAARDSRNAACATCLRALLCPEGPNKRRNISLLLQLEGQQLLIDCGKTLRDSLVTFGCAYNLSCVDAVFLTHDHMDAIGGLDDLRDLQPFDRPTFACPPAVAAAAAAAAGPQAAAAEAAAAAAQDRQDCRWYAPKNWLCCFMGARTFASISRGYSYLLRPFLERCSSSSSSSSSSSASPAAAAAAAADAEGIVSRTEDGEFAVTNKGRLLLRRKVACIDFRILNDTVLPAAAAAAAEAAAAAVAKAAGETLKEAAATQGIPRLAAAAAAAAPPARPADAAAAAADAQLKVEPIDSWGFTRLRVPGLQMPIFSFPIYHGGSYVCLGLVALGLEPFLLLSDVTAVPPVVLERLLQLPKPEVLILDAIGERPHAAHFCLQEALDLGVLLQPRRLLFVGMDCCLEHKMTNERLQQWLAAHREVYRQVRGTDSNIQEVRLAHDGLYLSFRGSAVETPLCCSSS